MNRLILFNDFISMIAWHDLMYVLSIKFKNNFNPLVLLKELDQYTTEINEFEFTMRMKIHYKKNS